MPCNSDYLGADNIEVELSKVACLLDELDGKPVESRYWHGYHPRVYNWHYTKEKADAMVSELCSRLQSLDVTKLSLEMQIFWRDHQKADAEGIQKDA